LLEVFLEVAEDDEEAEDEEAEGFDCWDAPEKRNRSVILDCFD